MKRKPSIRRGRRNKKSSANTKRVLNTDFEEEKKKGAKESISKNDKFKMDLSSITGQSTSTMENMLDKKVRDKDEIEASLSSSVDDIKHFASS
eukprot:2539177-Ditylum_brightwellii.AAC.1